MAEGRKSSVGLTESADYICLEDLQKTQNFSGLNPINLDYLGNEQCQPGYGFGPYMRENYVLHIVRGGCGVLRKNDKTYNIKQGQAFLIFPGETTFYQADLRNPWNYMWVGFHGFKAESMLLHAGFTRENPVITIKDMARLSSVMKDLLSSLDLTYSADLSRTGSLYRLMALLAENHEREEEGTHRGERTQDYQYVERAVELITGSYRSHLKVEDIAREIGISRNYLSSIFKREMGVSPQEFLIDFRLEVAAMLLQNSKEPVNAVASEVGYSDPLSFSKAFRRKYKMSPTEYREIRPELVSHDAKGDYTSDFPL